MSAISKELFRQLRVTVTYRDNEMNENMKTEKRAT